MLTGTETDQACVIEHTGRSTKTRTMTNGAVVVANHYAAYPHLSAEETERYLSNSFERYHCAQKTVAQISKQQNLLAAEHYLAAVSEYPVLNDFSGQQMVFIPKTGKVVARYQDTDAAVARMFED